MVDTATILLIFFAYFIGSIPSAVWVGKYFYNVDVREHGSGNSGATNTFRVLGKRAGFPVLIMDVLKGVAAVNLAHFATDMGPGSHIFIENQIVLGIAALMGHIFPVLASFRGGKGIATLLGVTIAIHSQAAVVAVMVFIVVFVIFKYVSLSSILGASSMPFSLMFLFSVNNITLILFGFFALILVLVTHQKNIERLLNKEESKMSLKKKTDNTIPTSK